MRNRPIWVAAVAALVLAACGSTVNTPEVTRVVEQTGGGTATTALGVDPVTGEPIAPGASGPGAIDPVTGQPIAGGGTGGGTAAPTGPAVTDPIELGFVTTATSNAAAFGISTGASISERDIINALIDHYNAAGGIAGRKITPVFADTDTGSTSWDADFAAACSAFTEDHDVEAVIGYVFAVAPALETCLTRRGVPHIAASFGTTATDLVENPQLLSLATPTVERRNLAKIDGAITDGLLTPSSKLGVLTESCPNSVKAWNDTVKPYLAKRGIPVATSFQLGCPRGSADAAAEAGRIGNLLLQFRSADVDRIIFVSVSEGPALFVLGNAAESQGYRPTYIVSSVAQTAVTTSQLPREQAKNTYGYGWLPVNDVNRGQWPALTAPARRCLDILAAKGIQPSSPLDSFAVLITCESFFLYEAALTRTRGDSDGAAVIAAVESLGDSHVSVSSIDGKWSFGPGRHDAPAVVRPFRFDDGCGCFVYGTRTAPVP
jgi:ABC-type branched-subunit amino acid transport system substrate-binding protein